MNDAARDAEDARAALVRLGLLAADARPVVTRLTGGVASDIWKVDLPDGPVCVKRALPKLRVAQDWRAPVERNASEVAWLETAARVVPEAVPPILAAEPASHLFVMPFLDPARHALWKAQLRDGIAETSTAAAVADRLVRIHAATAGDPAVRARFATDAIFHAIRLEPYLLATGRKWAGQGRTDIAAALDRLAAVTAAAKQALVHGDVSPKNILVGPEGPVFLDAECAWYGDPAFDLAFCLNHLLLKCLWTPAAAARFLACFDALAATYRAGVRWEPAAALEARAAALLPGLFLARIDGKSPVEYVTEEAQKDKVRRTAVPLLLNPPRRLAEVRAAWAKALGA